MRLPEQRQSKIAFLGPTASYSHQATLQYFNGNELVLAPQRTINDVFAAVQSRDADYGVVPFENSANGPVDSTLDCLVDQWDQYLSVIALAEIYVDIRHCLLGIPSSLDKDGLHGITDIYSHPQGLAQCRLFVSSHLPRAELHETPSTSEAARIVSTSGLATAAAISSELAAQEYHLEVLRNTIQDQLDNQTRFLILQGDNQSIKERPIDEHVLLSFSIDHERPGALADALHVFKRYDLNLTSINSRPSRQTAWHYLFFVELDCLGTPEQVASNLQSAFATLTAATTNYKQKGSWRRKGAVAGDG